MSKRREKEREIRFSRALVLHRNNSTIRKTYVYIVYYEVKTKKHITLGPPSCTAKFFCPLFSSPMHILLPRRRERNLSGKKASFQPVTRMDRLPSVRSLYRGLLISNDLLLGVTSCFSRQKEKGGGGREEEWSTTEIEYRCSFSPLSLVLLLESHQAPPRPSSLFIRRLVRRFSFCLSRDETRKSEGRNRCCYLSFLASHLFHDRFQWPGRRCKSAFPFPSSPSSFGRGHCCQFFFFFPPSEGISPRFAYSRSDTIIWIIDLDNR